LRDDGVYVLDNGIYMFLWVGLSVNPEWVRAVFGAQSAAQIEVDRSRLVELDNPQSQMVIDSFNCFYFFKINYNFFNRFEMLCLN